MTTSNNEPLVTNVGAELNGSLSLTGNLSVNGNVGIGTTSPEAKLDVQGIIRTYNKDTSNATWDNIQIWSDGTHGHIQSNGDENGLQIKSNTGGKIILDSDVEVNANLKLKSGVAVNEFSNNENLGYSDTHVPTQKAVTTYVDNKINNLEAKINNLEAKINNLESKNHDLESKINNLESKLNSIDFKNLDVTTLSAKKVIIGGNGYHFILETYLDKEGNHIDGKRGIVLRKRGKFPQGFLVEEDGNMTERINVHSLWYEDEN
ncbi:TMF family protein [Nostoc sp. TCL26-01]|uniref:TMF family protein n=1 Tax=Nostoc sp. TCL26-01 TaxID=2576904 RepID=UPI0015BDB6F9|nr:TMF family protein [Nostoc sp. TCL26-01]QLE56746.1 TMF family protein [Nostoc sp. TCL26-01]